MTYGANIDFRQIRNFKREQVEHAIKHSNGYISRMADILGCTSTTAKRYLTEVYPDLLAEFEDHNERLLDKVENKMMQGILLDGDPALIQFYLKSKGKHRGYGEAPRQENQAQSLNITVVPVLTGHHELSVSATNHLLQAKPVEAVEDAEIEEVITRAKLEL